MRWKQLIISSRDFLGEFSICPVYTGMNPDPRRAGDHVCDLPRVYGDEPLTISDYNIFNIVSENFPRLRRRRDESVRLENRTKDGQILFLSVFFDQKVLSAKMPSENILHTDGITISGKEEYRWQSVRKRTQPAKWSLTGSTGSRQNGTRSRKIKRLDVAGISGTGCWVTIIPCMRRSVMSQIIRCGLQGPG